MSWQVTFTKKAQKQINSLDYQIQVRIKKAILEKLRTNPLLYLESLAGELGGLYKLRVGNYRLICDKEDEKLTIIIVEIGHRSEVYR